MFAAAAGEEEGVGNSALELPYDRHWRCPGAGPRQALAGSGHSYGLSHELIAGEPCAHVVKPGQHCL